MILGRHFVINVLVINPQDCLMVKRSSSLFHKQGNLGSEQSPAQVTLRVCPSGGAGFRLHPQHQFGPSSFALQLFIPNTGVNSKFRSPSSQRLLEVSAQFGTGPTPTGAAGTTLPPSLAFQKVPWESPSAEVTRGEQLRRGKRAVGTSGAQIAAPDPTPGARSRE